MSTWGRGGRSCCRSPPGHGRYHDVVLVGFDEDVAIVHDPAEGADRRARWTSSRSAGAQAATGRCSCSPRARRRRAANPRCAGGAAERRGCRARRRRAASRPIAAGPASTTASSRERWSSGAASSTPRPRRCSIARCCLEPARPEAWTERGGLHFLAGRYDEAVARPSGGAGDRRGRVRARPAGVEPAAGGARDRGAQPRGTRSGKPALGRGAPERPRADARRRGAPRGRDRARRGAHAIGGAGGAPAARGDRRLRPRDRAGEPGRRRYGRPRRGTRRTSRVRPQPARPGADLGREPGVEARAAALLEPRRHAGSRSGPRCAGRRTGPRQCCSCSGRGPWVCPATCACPAFVASRRTRSGGPFDMRRRGLDLSFRHVLDAGCDGLRSGCARATACSRRRCRRRSPACCSASRRRSRRARWRAPGSGWTSTLRGLRQQPAVWDRTWASRRSKASCATRRCSRGSRDAASSAACWRRACVRDGRAQGCRSTRCTRPASALSPTCPCARTR